MESNSNNQVTSVDIKNAIYVYDGLHDKSRDRSKNGAIDAYLVMSKIGSL